MWQQVRTSAIVYALPAAMLLLMRPSLDLYHANKHKPKDESP